MNNKTKNNNLKNFFSKLALSKSNFIYSVLGILIGVISTLVVVYIIPQFGFFSNCKVNNQSCYKKNCIGMKKDDNYAYKKNSMHHNNMGMQDMTLMLQKKSDSELETEFLRLMIEHHQGAIDMSYEIIKNSKNNTLKSFAHDIVNLQTKEIKLMKNWLENGVN